MFQTPPPLLWRHYASWFPPKIPSQVSSESSLDDFLPSLAPTASPSFFNLFLMAWTCWMQSLHSWFTWLFQEGENRHPSQPNLIPINLPFFVTLLRPRSLYHPDYSKALHKIHPTSSLIQSPRPLLHAHHLSQQVSQNKIQAPIIFHHMLFKEDQQMTFQAKTSPQRHLQAL